MSEAPVRYAVYCRCTAAPLGLYGSAELVHALLYHHNQHTGPAGVHGLYTDPPLPVATGAEAVEVAIECQGPRGGATCPLQGQRRVWRVPAYFSAAATMIHHAGCEGHPMRVWLDGEEIVPRAVGP